MKAFEQLLGRYVVLPGANIDTDQIIPARFLTSTARSGFGRYFFNDWRLLADGTLNAECPLNDPANRGAEILVVGPNFGCGSSREHAAWALSEYGFRVVIGTTLADIFRSNALECGVLAVTVSDSSYEALLRDEARTLHVDLTSQTCRLVGEPLSLRAASRHAREVPNATQPVGPGSAPPSPAQRGQSAGGTGSGHEAPAGGAVLGFAVDPFARRCLLRGWDRLDYLLSHTNDIRQYEERLAGAGSSRA